MPLPRTNLEWIDLGLHVTGGLIILTALLIPLWRRLTGRPPDPLHGAPLRINDLTPLQVWGCFIINFLGASVGAYAARRIFAGAPPESLRAREGILGANIAQVLTIAAVLSVAAGAFRGRLKGFGLGRRPLRRDLLWAVPACLAGIASTTALVWLTDLAIRRLWPGFEPPSHTVFQTLEDPETPGWMRVLAFLGAGVLAPISEELLFRGILQSSLVRLAGILARRQPGSPAPIDYRPIRWAWRRWIPILVVGAIFGAMHSVTPQNVPALMVLGVLLGFLYERTGSLTLPILVHMLFNCKSLLWYVLG
jgi:membrane protease YdiL (CAAX protease family)